jgi:hypothetical protein
MEPCIPRRVAGTVHPHRNRGLHMLTLLIGILITIVIGAICFYLIEKFINDSRLANLLKILVVLICLASIVQRLWVLTGPGLI